MTTTAEPRRCDACGAPALRWQTDPTVQRWDAIVAARQLLETARTRARRHPGAADVPIHDRTSA